ncbi:MAG: hypothetical protein DCC65_15065 [Planctomycetota bacterium]|nr:MAG: hypothetical protein DCC65_15065 [Planctomycetota bacterium]
MSAIPPSPIASVLQSPAAQAEAARESDAARNADAQRARGLTSGPDAILEVEGTDTDDTQVHTDSGGLGSQGRYDAPPDEEPATVADETDGIRTDAEGRPRIDISA